MNKKSQPKFGVLLVNLGTPDAPTASAVRRYLAQFLSDRRVVDAPRLLWWFILHGIILRIRPRMAARAYQTIWTEQGSPLLVIAKQQQQALQAALTEQLQHSIPVALGMTYGNPSIASALQELQQQGVQQVLVLPLYPQYSSSTTASVFDAVAKALQNTTYLPELRFIQQYFDHPSYIQALAQSITKVREQQGAGQKLLLSFHGIPQRYEEDKGDPYPSQCRRTAELVAAELGLADDQWLCAFQSRFGREEWVKPYTDKTLQEWAQQGVKSVDVISPAFAADCLETLEELEIENRQYFTEAGGEQYQYIPCLNTEPAHIHLLTQLVLQHSQGW